LQEYAAAFSLSAEAAPMVALILSAAPRGVALACEFLTPFGPPTRAGDVVAADPGVRPGRLVWFDRVGPWQVVARPAGCDTPDGAPLFELVARPRTGAAVFEYVCLAPAPRPWWRPW
jgi:hypothetical protein